MCSQFCATRKGTQQAAGVLVKEARFVMNIQHKQRLQQVASSLRESKLRGVRAMVILTGTGRKRTLAQMELNSKTMALKIIEEQTQKMDDFNEAFLRYN